MIKSFLRSKGSKCSPCSFKMSNKNFIKLLIFVLIILRILGLTLGGLTLDSNGKLSVNRIYKYYGFLVFILMSIFDFISFYDTFTNYQDTYYNSLLNQANQLARPIIIYLTLLVSIIWNIYKLFNLIHFNLKGFKIAKIITKILNYNNQEENNGINMKIFLFWSLQIIILAIMSLENGITQKWSFMQIMRSSEFNITFALFWSLASMTWIVSYKVSNILEQINKSLKYLALRPGMFFDK